MVWYGNRSAKQTENSGRRYSDTVCWDFNTTFDIKAQMFSRNSATVCVTLKFFRLAEMTLNATKWPNVARLLHLVLLL